MLPNLEKEMEIYVRYHQISTNTSRPVHSIKEKKRGICFPVVFPFLKCEFAFTSTRLEAPRRLRAARSQQMLVRTHRPSRSSGREESPRASGSLPLPWYQMRQASAGLPQRLKLKWTAAFLFGILLLPTDETLKRYIPQPRREVVVWALSPSGSDLVRPLPF